MNRTISIAIIMVLTSIVGVACNSGISLTLKGEIENYSDDASSLYQLNIKEGDAELLLVPVEDADNLQMQSFTFSGIPGASVVTGSKDDTEYSTVPIGSDGTIDVELKNIESGSYILLLSRYWISDTQQVPLAMGIGDQQNDGAYSFAKHTIGEDDNGMELDLGKVILIGQ